MNKADLVNAIAEKADLRKSDSRKALDAFLEVTAEALQQGEKVTLVGFGTFFVVTRAARTARNPNTGVKVQVPEKKAVKFKAGTDLK
ncbi:MAG: HU family DNA-binding protein [Prevotellaceae bacterium]|jgi:DNA-binding protein HU-beta|nr:HU family DNA-binding protein [Prevotellaceae bacterium]